MPRMTVGLFTVLDELELGIVLLSASYLLHSHPGPTIMPIVQKYTVLQRHTSGASGV